MAKRILPEFKMANTTWVKDSEHTTGLGTLVGCICKMHDCRENFKMYIYDHLSNKTLQIKKRVAAIEYEWKS